MHCQVRSAERVFFDGEATMVVAESPTGEFAIMDGHAPLLAAVGDAPLRVKTGDGEVALACYGGALRVSNDGTVSVLVEDATPIEEIDLEGVRRRLAEIGDRPESEEERRRLLVLERTKERHG